MEMTKVTDCLSLFPQNILAIDEYGKTFSYLQAKAFSDEIGNIVNRRSLVFLVASNTIGSLMGYLAFLDQSSVSLMLSENTTIEQFKSLDEIYTPNYVWLPLDSPLLGKIDGEINLERFGYVLVFLNKESLDLHPDLALLLSTSGSTGASKLVKLSNKNLISNAESIATYLNIDDTERPITSLPMNYSYGLSVINSHIIKGATIILTTKSVVNMEFWSTFKKESATSIAGVPYTYELLSKLRFERMKLPSLRYMTQAGGRLSIDLIKKVYEISIEKGFLFYVMYGQTEATARMSYVPVEALAEKVGSIGIAIPGGEFKVLDENTSEIVENDKEGELAYRGDNVFGGYATIVSELSTFDSSIQWLQTGDLAKKDSDGFYYITGRKKRFVKIFGNRISLDMIEQILKSRIKDVACVGDDEQIRVYVEHEPEFDVTALLASQTHLFPSVFNVIVIDSIPKNESGKTQYSKLK